MRGINRVTIAGHLGKDPETRYMPNGTAVTNMSVATSEAWKDKNTGEMQERTEWHRIAVFGKLAEVCAEYLHKGSKAFFEGKLRTRKYEKDGVTKYSTEIIADSMQFLDSKNGNGGGEHRSERASTSSSDNEPPPGDFDDDIPF